jgi:hypothetical protein
MHWMIINNGLHGWRRQSYAESFRGFWADVLYDDTKALKLHNMTENTECPLSQKGPIF